MCIAVKVEQDLITYGESQRGLMSIVIVVKVSEGLVLAADSAATLLGTLHGPNIEQSGVLKTFYNADKLFQIGDLPIGVLTWGNAFIGPRTLESIVREWEHNAHWESLIQYKQQYNEERYSVRKCAESLLQHLTATHRSEFSSLPMEQQPAIGIIVAGYSEGEFFPEIWRFVVPLDEKVHNQRPDINNQPNFGASWFGLTDAIVRLHFGHDDGAVTVLSERLGVPESEIRDILAPFQYPIPFAQMPLQDAVDYANYIINIVIGRYRFVLGPDLCGGEIDIATITQKEFKWISQKSCGLE